MMLLKEQPVKPDRLDTISPVSEDGSFKFWEPCRTGKMPIEGKCTGEEFAQSFTYPFGTNWQVNRVIRDTLGFEPKWGWYNQETYRRFQKYFLLALPIVFERHGFKPGKVTALGVARRPTKGAWEFRLTGGNIILEHNFILAKLMGQEVFEREIWQEAIQMCDHIRTLTE